MLKNVNHFSIELTNHCNINCDFCANRYMTRKKGHMNIQLAKRLVRESKETSFCDKVFLNIMGEPLCYPNLFELLDFSNRINQNIALTTNGMALTDNTILQLLKYPNVTIAVSKHTHDHSSYTLKHASISYEQYNKQIEKLIDTKFRLRAKNRIFISMMTFIQYSNPRFNLLKAPEDIESVRIYWNDIARDIKKRYHVTWPVPKKIYPGPILILPDIYLLIQPIIHNWSGKIIQARKVTISPSSESQCSASLHQFNVLWDGSVTLCCVDYNGEHVYDTIDHRTIIDIFNTQKINCIRMNYTKRKNIPESCRLCMGTILQENGDAYQVKKPTHYLSFSNKINRMFLVYFIRLLWRFHLFNAANSKWRLFVNNCKWKFYTMVSGTGKETMPCPH